MKLFRTIQRNYYLSCLSVSLKGTRSTKQREQIVKYTFNVLDCLTERERVVVFGTRFKRPCQSLRHYLERRVVFRDDLQFILLQSSGVGEERGRRFLYTFGESARQFADNELDTWYSFFTTFCTILKQTKPGSL